MKQVTLHIEDSKFRTFIEFLKTLDYVKVEDSNSKVMKELESSLEQVRLIKEGKLPKKSVNALLDEL